MVAVGAESSLVLSQGLEGLLLSLGAAEDALDGGEGKVHSSAVLHSVQALDEAVLSAGVLETSSVAKTVVVVDEVVDEGGDVLTVVGREIRATGLEESAIGRRELALSASGLGGATDGAAEVLLEAGNDRGAVAGRGKGTDGVGEGETARDVGVGHDANEARGTAGGEAVDERRVKLSLCAASKASNGSGGGDERRGSESAHFD